MKTSNKLNLQNFYVMGTYPATDYEYSGNSPKGGIANIQPEMVGIISGMSHGKPFLIGDDAEYRFYVKKQWNQGWYRWEGGRFPLEWTPRMRQYMSGAIISKEGYHFGHYRMVCKFPKFRGSWPAWWFVDWTPVVQGGMGMPPEIDVFEQFIKKWWDRWKMCPGFIYGNNYESGKRFIDKSIWKWKPWDKTDHVIELIWRTDLLQYIFDGKTVLIITDHKIIPQKPMNMIISSGLGDWKPDEKNFGPFIVKSLTFETL